MYENINVIFVLHSFIGLRLYSNILHLFFVNNDPSSAMYNTCFMCITACIKVYMYISDVKMYIVCVMCKHDTRVL